MLLCVMSALHAQNSKLFTADRELSSSLINEIYQDRNGMIWVATEDGLNRYDGTKFSIYKHDANDDNSLAHNLVRYLFEDNKGHLLVGCYNGVQLYNPATDDFSLPAVRENGERFVCNINMILQRKNGEIWLSGSELSRLVIEDDKLVVTPIDLPIGTAVTDYLLEDSQGDMWVVVDENKVYRLNANQELVYYPLADDKMLINALGQDFQGNIYLGTLAHGLLKLSGDKRCFVSIPSHEQLSVRTIYPGNQDEVYVGTDGHGLKVYNNRLNELTDSRIDNSYFDLTKSKVHSVIKDSDGNFWLAIYQKGVMMIPAQPNRFKYIGYKSANRNIIGSCCVTALFKDKENTLWVGTDNDGIYRIDKDGKESCHFEHSTSSHSVPSIVINLFEDSDGVLWCGSFSNGMGRVDKQTGRFTPLRLIDSENSLTHRVYCIVEDSDKKLWIATMGGGVFCYDMNTQKVSTTNVTPNEKWVSTLFYAKEKNKLYVGTYNGVACVDLNDENHDTHMLLSRHIIYSINEDARGNVWIGTSEGLVCLENESEAIEKFTIANGLPSDVIYAVLEDDYNNLWISTDAGVSRFDPLSRRFINYFVGDGWQGNEFSKNTAFKETNGTLWFGGVNGVTYFNPMEITNPARKWNVAITDFYLHNTPVRKGMLSGGGLIIDKPVYEAEEFHLSHKDNAFTVEFATREYNSPERVSFMYSMNNADWVDLRSGVNRISFNDLHPGTYHLRIKAKDYDLLSDEKEIKIVIASPWYATTWAKMGYTLVFLVVAYLVYLQIKLRMRAKREMMEHQHAEAINEAKLQFFINISHEIRTPMSLVMSPLKKLMSQDEDIDRQRNYRTIYRNSERILSLVNQLMDIRKIDKGQMQLRFGEVELGDFLQELCDTFDYQVSHKHIGLLFNKCTHEVKAWVDLKNFDKILVNLLSNAVKFTPEGGQITISLSTGEDKEAKGALQNYIEISVSDTGIGMDATEMNRIFERFYQINNSHNNSNVGTGIGLHLTKSLVELHHGTIAVQNNEDGVGSRFTVRIPWGNAHLHADEIIDDTMVSIKPSKTENVLAVVDTEELDEKKQKARTKHRIVVIEDDEEIRRYVGRELSSTYHVVEFANGKEALPYIIKKNPSLIISDVMMPEMDGITLCRKVKQNVHTNHIPVLLLTAKNREEDNIDALDMGADAYMTKPFNIDLLRKTAESLIRSREVLRNCFTGNQEQEVKKPVLPVQSTDDKLLDRIMNVVNRNLSNQDLSVEMITKEVGISRVHLHRKLKELTNQSARDLIKNVRLKHAATLLTTTHYNVTEVTEMVGFSSITLFSRSFKELYGMPPTEYALAHDKKTITPTAEDN